MDATKFCVELENLRWTKTIKNLPTKFTVKFFYTLVGYLNNNIFVVGPIRTAYVEYRIRWNDEISAFVQIWWLWHANRCEN